MARYQGKKVVILGGASGMGLATAKKVCDATFTTSLEIPVDGGWSQL